MVGYFFWTGEGQLGYRTVDKNTQNVWFWISVITVSLIAIMMLVFGVLFAVGVEK
jgi:heme/copper-type cytochrome/quinol oxidase subunit 2